MITQEDIDAMEDGMGLVERLRQLDRGWPTILSTAADRIEQLERELAEIKKTNIYMDAQHQECREQLAEEKALADRLYAARMGDLAERCSAGLAYRKARGL